jgi:predicted ester cyclase
MDEADAIAPGAGEPASVAGASIRERLSWSVTPEQYRRIRRLWIEHSMAEDARDVDGLIATLTEDCVYELVPTGERWVGHDGARSFYASLLTAFPDITFQLTDIVIGPQGVMQVSLMQGTHQGTWAGIEATGVPVKLEVFISFPWDPAAGRFAGERIWFDRAVFGGPA